MEWISILIQVHECRDQTYQAHIYGIVDICNIFYIYTMSIKYKWIHKFSEVIRCYYTAVNERYYMSFRWSFTALFSFEIIGGKASVVYIRIKNKLQICRKMDHWGQLQYSVLYSCRINNAFKFGNWQIDTQEAFTGLNIIINKITINIVYFKF